MQILYFDCFSGISGDMILGSLIDLGVNLDDMRSELSKLNLSGYEIKSKKVVKKGISGTKVDIEISKDNTNNNKKRHLKDIKKIINRSTLSDEIKNTACEIFEKLATAEAKIHNTTKENIHFHEVGALDSIIDIVGAVIGITLIGVDKIYSSPVHLGRGFVNCEHGKIPVPAPATIELAKEIPVYSKGIEKELTTPTGIAILSTLCSSFDYIPDMVINEIGYGAGNSELEHPNLLRLIKGELNIENKKTDKNVDKELNEEYISIIEANIDDMNPEHYSHMMDLCFKEGALDVYFAPVQMKKNRPGTKITIISLPDKINSLKEIIFKNTTTLGVRSYTAKREILNRKNIDFDTSIGKASIKVGYKENKVYNWTVEYESALKLAKKEHLPLKEVYNIITNEFLSQKNNLFSYYSLHSGQ